MAYDENRDVEIEEIGRYPTAKGAIVVVLSQYDGGAVKVSIHRVREDKDGNEDRSKLGRLAADEAEGLGPLLIEAGAKLHGYNAKVTAALESAQASKSGKGRAK